MSRSPRRRSERGESLGPPPLTLPPPLLLRRLRGGGPPTPPLLLSRILSISDLRHAAPIPGKSPPPRRIPASTAAARQIRGRSAPRESSSAAEGSAEGRAPRLSLFFLYNSLLLLGFSPPYLFFSALQGFLSLSSPPPPFLSFRLRAAAPLSLSWSGRRLAASLPSGSLSRRPPRLHPLFVAAHARIGRSRSARGAIPHPTAPEPRRHRGAPRRPRIRARGPTRPAPPRPAIKISAPPFFLPPQAWGRHRHVAVVRGREKSKRPPAVAGGWGKGTGPRKAGANSPFTRLITSQFIY